MLRVLLEEPLYENERTMALIAHELTHALEVLSEPGVRSGPEMYFFFQQNRSLNGATFETQAAMDNEDKVHRELMQSGRRNQ